MLGKMLIHGLVGAAVIGSAAAVFAQAKDNGYLKPDALPIAVTDKAKPAGEQRAVGTGAAKDNGYVLDRDRGREHKKHEHRREGRHHDDDDDD